MQGFSARFPARFNGGPMNAQSCEVGFDPVQWSDKEPPIRPAMHQEFRRTLTNQFGRPTGRVGVFVYKLIGRDADDRWVYNYLHYGEHHVTVSG